jgi:hypothetical protein
MDYDIPLEYFGGKTAYQVSKEGYSKHLSQQWTWFTSWINGKNNHYTKSTDIKSYSPLKYGLFYSQVGEDIQKNDMFENLIYYKTQIEQKKIRQQELAEEEYRRVDKELINQTMKINNKKQVIIILMVAFLIILLVVIIIKLKRI